MRRPVDGAESMSGVFPADLEEFVQQELASHEYGSRDDLVVDAVRVLRELKTRHQKLRDDVRHSIAQAEQGNVRPLDTEATKSQAREVPWVKRSSNV